MIRDLFACFVVVFSEYFDSGTVVLKESTHQEYVNVLFSMSLKL